MEVFGIIIFVAILIIKQLAANEKEQDGTGLPDLPDTPVREEKTPRTAADALTGSMSAGGAMKSINRALDELDAAREDKRSLSAQDLRRGFEDLKMAPRAAAQKIRAAQEQRNADERESSERRWELARRKQADRSEVHSIHMDSCEERLENVKILYDAGILDREEYQQRVRRIKKAHALRED